MQALFKLSILYTWLCITDSNSFNIDASFSNFGLYWWVPVRRNMHVYNIKDEEAFYQNNKNISRNIGLYIYICFVTRVCSKVIYKVTDTQQIIEAFMVVRAHLEVLEGSCSRSNKLSEENVTKLLKKTSTIAADWCLPSTWMLNWGVVLKPSVWYWYDVRRVSEGLSIWPPWYRQTFSRSVCHTTIVKMSAYFRPPSLRSKCRAEHYHKQICLPPVSLFLSVIKISFYQKFYKIESYNLYLNHVSSWIQ